MKFLNTKLLWIVTLVLLGFLLFETIGFIFHNHNSLTDHERKYQERRFSKFIFAGELLPYKSEIIRRKLINEINTITRPCVENTILLQNHKYYFDIIEPILKRHHIPIDFKYLAVVESGLKMNARSSKGAVGLWQFQKETAVDLGLIINSEVDERMNLERSTEAVCMYLKKMKVLFGDWTSVAIAYNMGPTALFALKKRHHVHATLLKLNSESSVFIYRILAYKMLFEHPEIFKYKIQASHIVPNTLKVVVRKTIPDLSIFAREQGIDIINLKRHNPWLISNKLTMPSKAYGKYFIVLISSSPNSEK